VRDQADGDPPLRTAAGPADPDAALLFQAAYAELHSLARRHMRRERPDHTLQPTALVHEAYLRLARNPRLRFNDRTHFLAIAATEMRRVLVEHARALRTRRRGSNLARATWADDLKPTPGPSVEILALDEALVRLERRSARQARVVEMRLFSGMSVEEIAGLERVSERTVKYDWQVGRAFVARALHPG
jgi:RNA polymerase sigma factor (TIGR02999 family)